MFIIFRKVPYKSDVSCPVISVMLYFVVHFSVQFIKICQRNSKEIVSNKKKKENETFAFIKKLYYIFCRWLGPAALVILAHCGE